MSYKLWLTIALIIVVILFLASIIEYIPPENGEQGSLSIVWQRNIKKAPCTGELILNSQDIDGEKCQFRADVTTTNCEEKDWYVFQGDDCSGSYICNKKEVISPSQWKCAWEDKKGTYSFKLCVDGKIESAATIAC